MGGSAGGFGVRVSGGEGEGADSPLYITEQPVKYFLKYINF